MKSGALSNAISARSNYSKVAPIDKIQKDLAAAEEKKDIFSSSKDSDS